MSNAEPRNDPGVSGAVDANLSSLSADEGQAALSYGISRYARNSAANAFRLALQAAVAILLPAYLTHRLPATTYGAWVLILQLGAYVSYLDFGVQVAISKYIAEFEAKRDLDGCGRSASAGFAIILAASALGVLLTAGLAWRAPELFNTMPPELIADARVSIVLVGISLSATLAASVFSAIFLGLQRYEIPMLATVVTRLLYAGALCAAVAAHGSLLTMGCAVALTNLAGAALQVGLWKKLAGHIRVSLRRIDRVVLRQMLGYCAVLTIWSLCMLFITGLDITLVGHYDFGEVAYYSIASAPSTLILMLLGAVLNPLLPAVSAMSVERTPAEMGAILLRTTRYSTAMLLLTGLPIILGGYSILRMWVGARYASHAISYLQILLLANILRNLCGPYATMVVALSRQRVATVAAVSEGVVNLGSSVWLAKHDGAIGVALGTLIGAVAGLAVHFGVSMHYTYSNLAVSRARLFCGGILRPATLAVPSLLLMPLWGRPGPISFAPPIWLAWGISTILLAWFVALSPDERAFLKRALGARLARTR